MKLIYMQTTIDFILREHSNRFDEIQSLGVPEVRQISREGTKEQQYYIIKASE